MCGNLLGEQEKMNTGKLQASETGSYPGPSLSKGPAQPQAESQESLKKHTWVSLPMSSQEGLEREGKETQSYL